jgi:hypothetical protein
MSCQATRQRGFFLGSFVREGVVLIVVALNAAGRRWGCKNAFESLLNTDVSRVVPRSAVSP